jgi:tRNA (guanine37-N1)-methyltransferase
MTLKTRMEYIVPKPLLHLVPNSFDVIGNIAIISIPPKLDDYKALIAQAIISKHGNISTVLNKVSMLEGEDRVGRYEILSGTTTMTEHREYGFCYRLDINEVFFNPHLSYERFRVASQVKSGEHILVPFCGVGPYVVPAASRGASVVAVEKNQKACKWLAENVRLNRVSTNVSIICGDASHISHMLRGSFHKAVLPIPYGMDSFLYKISGLVQQGGIIHFYTFRKKYQIQELLEEYRDNGFDVIFYRRCGNVAPGVSRWVFDLKKQC